MLTSIRFETDDLLIVKQKMDAYKVLFEVEPVLFISGLWFDQRCSKYIQLSTGKEVMFLGYEYGFVNIIPTDNEENYQDYQYLYPIATQEELDNGSVFVITWK